MNSDFAALVKHFFGRFFDSESRAAETDAQTALIQFLALLILPGLVISFLLVPDHPLVTLVRDKMWTRTGDRYVFVCYAMTVMGLVMTFKWDSLFPDRRDYLILSPLPISSKRMFAAKVVALCAFLLLFVIAINVFSLLIMPSVYATQTDRLGSYWDAFLAHALGTIGGSLFTALFFAALQGVLINAMSPDAFRRLSPWIQMISIVVLVTILLIIPLFKETIPTLTEHNGRLLDYFPCIWFLGLYEAFLPGTTLMPSSFALGKTAIEGTAIVFAVFVLTYFIGYRRYARRILESVDSDTVAPRPWHGWVSGILNQTLLRNPYQRATFYFIGKIAGRSPKHRILTALYSGVGISLALSSLFVFDFRATSGIPFRLSTLGALEAPLILSFLLVTGLRATFNVPYELGSNWIFQVTDGTDSEQYLKGVRKWLFLCRVVPVYAVIASFEFAWFAPTIACFHLIFDLTTTALLLEFFFFKFSKVPFTCSYPSGKLQLVAIAAAYLYGFTTAILILGQLKRVATVDPLRMAWFMVLSGGLLYWISSFRGRRHAKAALVYDEGEAAILSLTSDRGYWTHSQDIRPSRPSRPKPTRDTDLDEEIQIHLQMAARDRMDRGESPDDARAGALREFGNVALVQETTRSVWTWTSLEQLFQDIRFGSRILWKSPGLSTTTVILIALVIGGNTTVYSMVHALLTKPAPGVTAKNLVTLGIAGQPGDTVAGSFMQYLDMVEHAKTVNPLIGFTAERLSLGLDNGTWAFTGSSITPKYFEVLGVEFARGRGFTDEENRLMTTGLAAIISYRVWQEQFHSAENVIGLPILVNGHPATIVGVTARKFQGAFLGYAEDVWVPLLTYARVRGLESAMFERGAFGVTVMGKLAAGVSLPAAQAEFETISNNLETAAANSKVRLAVSPYFATSFGGMAVAAPRFLGIFSILTGITLFVVCANVANLMLSRAIAKQRETALRQSLGASRGRVLRMLIAEALSVAVAAWVAACLLSYWFSRTITWLVPGDYRAPHGMRMTQMNLDFTPDWKVFAYAMLLALVAMIAFTLAPAIRSWRQELLPGLRSGEQSVAAGSSKLSRVLVIGQLAFSVLLLTSAGLAYRSLSLIRTSDLHFQIANLLLVTVNPTLNIPDRQTHLLLLEKLRDRLRAIPGAQSVSYVRLPPPYFAGRQLVRSAGAKEAVTASINYVGPDYLRALGWAPLLGREFSPDDRARATTRVLINQDLAEALWPGQSAVGQTLILGRDRKSVEVIGVCANALFIGPDLQAQSKSNLVLLAEQQDPAPPTSQVGLIGSGEETFYLRYSGNLEPVTSGVGRALREVDDRIPLVYMRTMQQQVDSMTFGFRPVTLLLTMFGATSLLIAAIGQYAVVAFDMKRRTREFGVRVAMGASSRQILGGVLREAMVLTGIGLLLGFLLSATTGTTLQSFLYGVSPTDGITYLAVFSLLTVASFLACYLPARRASRTDPLAALRSE